MATTINTSSPYINAYDVNSVHSSTIDKLSSNSEIQKTSNHSGELTQTDGIVLHERALSQSISNSTTGIAVTNIAQNGLEQQKDILLNIKDLVMQTSDETMNQENKELIAKEVDKLLQNYESIAHSTKYKDEALLKATGESSDDLSVVTDEEIVSIYKADTLSISESLKTFSGDFTNNSSVRNTMLDVLDQNINELASFSNDFQNISNKLEVMVEEKLTQEQNPKNSKSTIADIDYGKEVSNFSKNNLLTQLGFLMQTQANAHTQRTIEILK